MSGKILAIAIITVIFLPFVLAQDYGNLKAESLNFSENYPKVGEEVTVWVNISSTKIYYNVDVALYIDFSIYSVKKIPHIDGKATIYFTVIFKEEGIHNVTVVVDYLNNITEDNENDNSISSIIYVEEKNLPDLSIKKITSSEKIILEGMEITFYIFVYSSNASVYGIPITIFVDDEIVENKTIPYIAENSSYTVFFTYKFTEGFHRISGVVDLSNNIEESNESNNYLGINFTVYPKNFNCNIVVKGVYTEKSSAYYGEDITVYTVIFNDSNYTLEFVDIAVFYDMQLIKIISLPNIIEHQSLNVSFEVVCYTNLSGENHTISVYADYKNYYNETNESDNWGSRNIRVYTNNEDIVLTPADIFLSSSKPVEGTYLTIYGRIWNVGDVEIFVNVSMLVDSTYIGNFSLSILPHSNRLVSGVWLTKGGWHNISIIVRNLEVKKLIWVEPALPILRFLNNSLQVSQEKVYLNQSVWIYALIENSGNSSCNVGVVFTERKNDSLKIIGYENVSVGAKSYAYIKTIWLPHTIGNITVKAEFIPQPYISFLNLNISKNVEVIEPLADIEILNYSIEIKNYSARLNITLGNTGEIAAQNFKVGVFINQKIVNSTFISILPSNSVRNITMNLTLWEGINHIKIYADMDNVVREHNETNNNIVFKVKTPYRGIPLSVILAVSLGIIGFTLLLAFFSKRVRFVFAAVFYSLYEMIAKVFFSLYKSPLGKGFKEKYEEFRKR